MEEIRVRVLKWLFLGEGGLDGGLILKVIRKMK